MRTEVFHDAQLCIHHLDTMTTEVLDSFRRYQILSGFDSEALKRGDAKQPQTAVVRGGLPVGLRSNVEGNSPLSLWRDMESRHFRNKISLPAGWGSENVLFIYTSKNLRLGRLR